jgi:hypothetical protein
MVLSGGGRYSSLISSRTNVCGGNNKSGLPSRIGPVSNRRAFDCNSTCYVMPSVCIVSKSIRMNYRPNQKYLG